MINWEVDSFNSQILYPTSNYMTFSHTIVIGKQRINHLFVNLEMTGSYNALQLLCKFDAISERTVI